MRAADDRGALSIEYVILTPIILLVFALIYVFGRIAEVNGRLDSATRDAARVASVAPDYAQARTAARQTVEEEVGGSTTCKDSLVVNVSDDFAPGSTITVRATCTYPISDAGIPGAPGSLTVTSQFSTVIDPNRTLG